MNQIILIILNNFSRILTTLQYNCQAKVKTFSLSKEET